MLCLLLAIRTCYATLHEKNNIRSAPASYSHTVVLHWSHKVHTTNHHLCTKGERNGVQRRTKVFFGKTTMWAVTSGLCISIYSLVCYIRSTASLLSIYLHGIVLCLCVAEENTVLKNQFKNMRTLFMHTCVGGIASIALARLQKSYFLASLT